MSERLAADVNEESYRTLFERVPVAMYRTTADGTALDVNQAMVDMMGYPDRETLLSTPVVEAYVDPEDRDRFRSLVERDGVALGTEFRLRRWDGTQIWVRDSARVVCDENGDVSYFEGALIDITEQRRAEDRLRRQNVELSAMHGVTVGLLNRLETAQLLEDILARATALAGTKHGYVYVVEDEAGEIVVTTASGEFENYMGYRLRPGEGMAGRVWQSGEPLVVDDYATWASKRPGFEFMHAVVALPLLAGEEVVGVIGLAHLDQKRGFSAEVMGLLSRFAQLASLALHHARLYEAVQAELTQRLAAEAQRRKLVGRLVHAQEEERRRIATEIHDDPVQAMTAVEMRVEAAKRRMTSPEDRQALEDLSAVVVSAISRLRSLLFELRPPALDKEGLASALRAVVERIRGETGARFTFDDRMVREPPTETRTVLYRVAQEALANVRKHARAGEVQVSLAEREGGVLLRIRDDGGGFDVASVEAGLPGHLGIVSMRERAEMAGGWCRVTAIPEEGTTVEVWLPVEKEEDHAND
jgi:PAS domain S-box-containing protein